PRGGDPHRAATEPRGAAFAREDLTGATITVPPRIATLHDEPRDHAMHPRAIEEPATRERDELRPGARGRAVAEVDRERAALELHPQPSHGRLGLARGRHVVPRGTGGDGGH